VRIKPPEFYLRRIQERQKSVLNVHPRCISRDVKPVMAPYFKHIRPTTDSAIKIIKAIITENGIKPAIYPDKSIHT